jgi:hypothetical protein
MSPELANLFNFLRCHAHLRDLTLLTSLASMAGLWAGLAGAVWQRTWIACRVGIQGITWSSVSL